MTTLQGRAPKDTYKDLLQVSNANAGVDATLRAIEDGEGTATLVKVSTTATQIGAATLVDSSENEVLATAGETAAVNYALITGAATGNPVIIAPAGDDTASSLMLRPKSTGNVILADSSSNEVIKTAGVASAVNEVTITNAATGTAPTIEATGGDTVVALNYLTKGGGSHVFQVNSATVMSVLSTGITATQVVVGSTTPVTVGGVSTWQVQSVGTGSVSGALATYANAANGPILRFHKSRGTTTGAQGTVAASDALMTVQASGSDGATDILAARMSAVVEGTVSTGVVPGAFRFDTRNLAGTLTTRMSLNSEGNLGLGTTSPDTLIHGTAAGSLVGKMQCTLDTGSAIWRAVNDAGATFDFLLGGSAAADAGEAKIQHSADAPISLWQSGVRQVTLATGGNFGIGNITPTEKLDLDGDAIRLRTAQTPASAAATGGAGTICWDSNYIYVCVATDTWKRVAISTWP